MRISLMSHIPYNLVSRCIEDSVYCYGELDDSQTRSNMASCPRANFDQALADCCRKLAQLITGHGSERRRKVERTQKGHCDLVSVSDFEKR